MDRCAVQCAFVPHAGGAALLRGTRRAQLCVPRRRPRTRAVTRMAKFQRGEEKPSPLGEDSSPLRPPPSALPTLSSLSGRVGKDRKEVEKKGAEEAAAPEKISAQGTGFSAEQEASVITFLKEVADEFKVIDWPSLGRVFKITIIVIVTMVVASVGIYTVDGFFLWLSHRLFDTPVL